MLPTQINHDTIQIRITLPYVWWTCLKIVNKAFKTRSGYLTTACTYFLLIFAVLNKDFFLKYSCRSTHLVSPKQSLALHKNRQTQGVEKDNDKCVSPHKMCCTASCAVLHSKAPLHKQRGAPPFSTAVSLFSTGLSSFSTGLSSFSTELSSFSNKLSSFSTGLSSFSTGLSSFSTGLSLFSTELSSFSTKLSFFSTELSSFPT